MPVDDRDHSSSPGRSEYITQSGAAEARVPVRAAQHAFAPEARLLGNTARPHVLGVCAQLHACNALPSERPPGDEPEGPCRDAAAARIGAQPVADLPDVALLAEAHADRPEHLAVRGVRDRKRGLAGPGDVGQGVLAGVRLRNLVEPSGNLGVAVDVPRRLPGRRSSATAEASLHHLSVPFLPRVRTIRSGAPAQAMRAVCRIVPTWKERIR